MLVSLAQMKDYLGITNTTEYDSFLTTQLEIVSDAVELYCSRKFEQATYLQTYFREDFPNDSDFKTLQLAVFPVVSITSVKERDDESDLVGITYTDYRINKSTAILQKNQNGRFFYEGDIIEVEYSAGYATTPSIVLSVVYSIVQERYNKKVNGIDLNFGSDIQRISIPGTIGVDFDYSLENNQRKTPLGAIIGNYANVLDPYRSEMAVMGSVRLIYVD